MKKLIRSMGANKTEKAIGRASKAFGGVSKVVEAFESKVNMPQRLSMHRHKLSATDESLISRDLRALRPFSRKDGCHFESFVDIHPNPTIH